jgi:hypothetical protein
MGVQHVYALLYIYVYGTDLRDLQELKDFVFSRKSGAFDAASSTFPKPRGVRAAYNLVVVVSN